MKPRVEDLLPSDTDDFFPEPQAKKLGELTRRVEDDPTELLRNGYLCRGGGLLCVAPTGIGKSTFAAQAQILFALGRPIFGIEPTRPLRSLVIQAENDDGDMAEMRDGVIQGLGLSEEEIETAYESVFVVCEDSRTSRLFFEKTLQPLLELYSPDLVWIDPALAYLGGDALSQRDVGAFLRNYLNPLLHRFNCAAVVIHHTNKPPSGNEKQNWQAGDFAYLGAGSAEWANWARAVLAIRSIGSHSIFELRAAKRGRRIGWKNEKGENVFSKFIAHSPEPDKIYWREIAPEGIAEVKRTGTEEDLIALVPVEKPISKNLLIDQWKDRYGNHQKGRALLEQLIADGVLHVWTLTRSGTNPAKLISHKPQP